MVRKLALFIALGLIVVGCSGQPDENATSQSSTRSESVSMQAGGNVATNAELAKNRAQVRGATLQVRVAKLDDAEKKVEDAIKESGGFEETLTSSDLASPDASLSIQARVPVAKMDDVIASIEGLGTRLAKSISMQDVTAQIVAYDTQLKAQQQNAERLRKGGKNTSTANTDGVRRSIQTIENQRNAQVGLAAYATLDLTLRQGAVPISGQDPNWFAQAYGESSSAAVGLLHVVATGFLWLLFMSPFYLPVAFIAWLVHRAMKKKAEDAQPRILSSPHS